MKIVFFLLIAISLPADAGQMAIHQPVFDQPEARSDGPGQTEASIKVMQRSTQTDTDEEIVYVTESGYAEFTSRVPLHTFTGESGHLTGMIDFRENLVDFYLDLKTLKTGIGRRDRDMYQTLDVENYPFAEFTGTLVSSFDEQTSGRQFVETDGEFTVHGVTRDVRIEGYLEWQGDELRLETEWTLLLDDYNIEPPGILGYKINEEQEIRIEATLKPRSAEEL